MQSGLQFLGLKQEIKMLLPLHTEVDFVGGDKPAKEMKDVQGLEVQAYKDALQDIVKAIAVADLLGKSLKDF